MNAVGSGYEVDDLNVIVISPPIKQKDVTKVVASEKLGSFGHSQGSISKRCTFRGWHVGLYWGGIHASLAQSLTLTFSSLVGPP